MERLISEYRDVLTDEEFRVVWRRAVDEESWDEIAEDLETTPYFVKLIFRRAIEKLGRSMGGDAAICNQ